MMGWPFTVATTSADCFCGHPARLRAVAVRAIANTIFGKEKTSEYIIREFGGVVSCFGLDLDLVQLYWRTYTDKKDKTDEYG
jgi:hypothetical protein